MDDLRLKFVGASIDWTPAILATQKDAGQPARDLLGDLIQIHLSARARGTFDREIIAVIASMASDSCIAYPSMTLTSLFISIASYLRLWARLNRRYVCVRARPVAVAIAHQFLERLRDGEHLIRPHARTGERRHATDSGDALRLGLEHHHVERLLSMAARATHN